MPRRSVGVGNRLRCERTYAVVGGGALTLVCGFERDVEIIN